MTEPVPEKPYVYQEYPRMVYHATLSPKTVADGVAHTAAQKEGFVNHPDELKKKPEKEKDKDADKDKGK